MFNVFGSINKNKQMGGEMFKRIKKMNLQKQKLISGAIVALVLIVVGFLIVNQKYLSDTQKYLAEAQKALLAATAHKAPISEKMLADLAEANNAQILVSNQAAIIKQEVGQPGNQDMVSTLRLPDGSTYSLTSKTPTTISALINFKNKKVFVGNNPDISIVNLKQSNAQSQNKGKIDKAVKDKLDKESKTAVFIHLSDLPEPYAKGETKEKRLERQDKFKNKKDKVLNALKNHANKREELPIINSISADIDKYALTILEASGDVEKVTPVTEVQATLDTSLDEIHAKDVWPLMDLNNNSITGVGMRIAIIDTGVDYLHPDLGGCLGPNCKVIGGHDYVNNDNDPMDDHGHGTHVAATAAGKGLLYGVAPDAKIIAYKVLNSGGSGSSDKVTAAINAAADPNGDGDSSDHVDVGSMSLGGAGTPDDEQSTAVDRTSDVGVVWTISAGNSGPYESTIGSPGKARSAITVAAACKSSQIGQSDGCQNPIASFSSRGPLIWEGEDLKKPDIAAPGVSICAARWDGAFSGSPTCFDNQHIRISGTSMAAPHMAGAAALVRQAYPGFTPAQVKEQLKGTAVNLGMDYNIQGAGLVDLKAAIPISSKVKAVPYIWQIVSDPTIKTFTTTQQFSITPNVLDIDTLDVSTDLQEDGVNLSFDKTTLQVAGKTTDTFTATLTVDNDITKWGYINKRILLKENDVAKGAVFLFINIKPTIKLSVGTSVDYGSNDPSLSNWSSEIKSITVTNLRVDTAQSLTVSSSAFPSGVNFNINPSNLSIPANGSVNFDTQFIVDNSSLANGIYKGNFTIANQTNSILIQTIFYKLYKLSIEDPANTDQNWINMVLIDSGQSDFTYYNAMTQNPEIIYLPDSGPYNILVTHIAKFISPDGYQSRYVVAKEGITFNSAMTVKISPSDANHIVHVVGSDEQGIVLNNLDARIYALLHYSAGNIIMSSGGCGNCVKNYYSDMSSDFELKEIYGEKQPLARLHYFWNSFRGLTADKTIANTSSDLKLKYIQSDINKNPTAAVLPLTFAFMPVLGWMDWGGASNNDDKITSSFQAIYSTLPTGTYFEHYTDWSRGTCSSSPKYCATVFMSPLFDITDNKRWLRNSDDSLFPMEGNVVYNGLGPSFWAAKFNNSADTIDLQSWNNYGFLRQDYSLQEFNKVPYSIFQNGSQIISDNLYPYSLPNSYYDSLPLINSISVSAPGVYEFKIDSFVYQIKSQNMNAKIDAKFDTSATDPNPPSIKRLYFFTNDIRSEVYNETVPNRLEFEFDPVGGAISQAKASYSTDGTSFAPLVVNSGASGYSADIPVLPNLTKLTLKIEATDSTNNSLAYTFELPRGEAPSPPGNDTQPPVTSITDPVNGQTITDSFYHVKANAADNFEVSKVELYCNDKLIGITKNYPYTFVLETGWLKNGSYTLKTKAYDASGNIGESAPVTITVNTDESWVKAFITSPVEGDTISGKVTVSADVYSAVGVGVKYVKFYSATSRDHSNQTLIGQATSAPYAVIWDTTTVSPGDYYVYALPADGLGNTRGFTYERHVTVTAPPVIMTKTASPATVSVGSKITYNIKIENPNNDTITNLRISDPISSDTEYIDKSATAGGTYAIDSRLVSWVIPSLGPKASIEVQFQVNVIR